MTTKIKITVGFLLMLLFQGILTFLGYTDLRSGVTGFANYQEISVINTRLSDFAGIVNLMQTDIYKFLDSKDPKFIEAGKKAAETGQNILRELDVLIHPAEQKAVLQKLHDHLDKALPLIAQVENGVLGSGEQYAKTVQPAMIALGRSLFTLADQSRVVENVNGGFAIAEALEKLASTRSTMSRFALSRSPEDAKRLYERFGDMQNSLNFVGETITSSEGKNLVNVVMENRNASWDAFKVMEQNFAKVNANLETLQGYMKSMDEETTALNTAIDATAIKVGNTILGETKTAQISMLVAGGAGMAAAVIVALFIIIGLNKVLHELSAFAGAIAAGDFNRQIRVKEKGEIGLMVDAVKKISVTLAGIIHQANALADKISSGNLRDRLDAKAFPGDFASLATGVNTVGDAYTSLLDAISLPIIACDNKNSVLFQNVSGQGQLGAAFVNANPEVSGLGAAAMSQRSAQNKELSVTTHGKRADMAVSIFPAENLQKNVVGYISIFTDLTEMKERQNTVLQAVAEASGISDRVAAASEQLAAQVEQISRGAEVQRSRVETTASAMTEMNSTVMEVARNAGQASDQSEHTRRKAGEGAGLVNKVVDSMSQVNAIADHLHGNMQELGRQAESIGSVMNVISDIADQTNLLALNAAIEAARAGEAGRGFAVVADEVRKLAEKTMQATHDVGENILSIQQSARTNITEVGNAVGSISEATKLANDSGSALQEIVHMAAANSSVVASIATAAEEQSATSEEINRSIEEISHVVAETTDGMLQSSAAVQDLSQMAQELRRVMERLR